MADQQASDTPGVTISGDTVVGGDPPVANGADKYAPRLPDAVRRAAARAEELQQQMSADAQEVQGEEASSDQLAQEPSPQPQPISQPQDDWQNRYRTLQGKYDHELPQLRSHIQQLENLIATMQRPAATQEPAQQQMAQIEIPEEDYTTYGPDFVDSTRRWARAEVQQDIEAMRREIDGLKQYANQTTGDRLKDRVRAELDRDPEIAGQWQYLDTDAGFNAWLNDIDPFSGARRLDMLRSAYASGDAVRTGRFFKAYLQEHTVETRMPTAASQTPGPVTQYPNGNGHYGNGAGQVDLAAYAAPGRAPNATPGPGAGERRIWTNRDIQAFYEGRLKGRFKGREAEADRLERDILAAAQEGRVSP
jgi:FtsZ-binding cell division protein ZapB